MNKNFVITNIKILKIFLFVMAFLILSHSITSIAMVTFAPVKITVPPSYRVYLYYGPYVLLRDFAQFAFFTNQTNLILGFATLLLAIKPQNKKVLNFFFFAGVLMFITFLIFWALLSWVWPWGQVIWLDYFYLITHGFAPLVGFYIIYLKRHEIFLRLREFLYPMFYLFAYFLFLLILYLVGYYKYGKPVAVYPFAQFFRPFFYLGGNIALILLINNLGLIVFVSLPIPVILLYKYLFKIQSVNFKQELYKYFNLRKK